MIEQRLVLAFFGGGNQVPDEALDLVVAFIVSQTVNQQGSAWRGGGESQQRFQSPHATLSTLQLAAAYIPTDHLHVSLSQVPFEPTMV